MIKKLIPLFLALAAMFCIVPMRGDTPPDEGREIPIRKVDKSDLIRSLNDLFVYYDGAYTYAMWKNNLENLYPHNPTMEYLEDLFFNVW